MASKQNDSKTKAEKIRRALERAYRLGYMEGKNERNLFLNTLKIVNHNLWQELCRLDRDEPTEGISISCAFAENLAKAVEKKHRNYARDLRKRIRQSNQRLDKILRILKQLERHK